MWINDFLEKLFPTKSRCGSTADPIVIDIPAELYYKELALYQATSLIGNALGRSEFRCYENGQPVRNHDYYQLNVSPNINQTSSQFWHKVLNKLIRGNEALIVEVAGGLYCADSFMLEQERPIIGNIYSGVSIDNLPLDKKFYSGNSYYLKLNNSSVKELIDGMYADYGSILSSAAQAFKKSNGQKYILHIDSVQAGDEEFEKQFQEVISAQLKEYLSSENAVYPEFEGFHLTPDKNTNTRSSEDFLKLKKDIFSTVSNVFHIPDSMMTGNITNMKEIIGAFLSFGVDPYADLITEALNKSAGFKNFSNGNFYRVDTGKINHRDIFEISDAVSNLISSAVFCVDECREELGLEPLNTEWSRKHYMTKNFALVSEILEPETSGGGETNEE